MVKCFKRKDYDRQACGISPVESELDEAPYSIIELDAEQQFDQENYEKQQKIENDQKQAEDVLVKAMETFRESRKKAREVNLSQERNVRQKVKHCDIYRKNLSRNMG